MQRSKTKNVLWSDVRICSRAAQYKWKANVVEPTCAKWSHRLGLATSPLFGGNANLISHTAMLDGVAGSFVLSDATSGVGFDDRSREYGVGWSWSAMMRHHVLVEKDMVTVTKVSSQAVQRISRTSVDGDLEKFLRYLEDAGPVSEDVVDHTIRSFQRLRAELSGEGSDHLAVFLFLVSLKLANPRADVDDLVDLLDAKDDHFLLYELPLETVKRFMPNKPLARRFYEDLLTSRQTGREMHVDLTVRYAGSELFQAAQLVPPPRQEQGTLFGLDNVRVVVRPHSLKGVAYTPIGLARTLAEQAIGCFMRPNTREIVVADPACGSGTFLVEALAALGRQGWSGQLKLVGYDTSKSAVASTRFAIAAAKRDYPNIVTSEIVVEQDFLSDDFSPVPADIVLMNPPYLSWPEMDAEMQARVRRALGANYRNRPDLSMAFVEKALETANPKAVLATLVPVGVIAGESASKWRASLRERANPRLIAVLGDHSLFRFATVNVSALMLEKGCISGQNDLPDTQMLWASEEAGAASAALRELRKMQRYDGPPVAEERGSRRWSINLVEAKEVGRRANWLPKPNLLSARAIEALRTLEDTVNDLFDVKMGVRAGDRSALVLSQKQWEELPKAEREGFKPIAEKQSISEGRVRPVSYFFEYGSKVTSEEELSQRFPRYFSKYLLPSKATLSSRARTGDRWWLPSEARNTWRMSTDPRIVSRQWFKNDGFAVDHCGEYAVIQGYAWFPTKRLRSAVEEHTRSIGLLEVLKLYCVLFSSDVFFSVAREYSTNSAGGQLNLQQNLIRGIPLPLIPKALVYVPGLAGEVLDWADAFPTIEERNHFARRCYGFGQGDLS